MLLVGFTFVFHYRNNLKGALLSSQMEASAPLMGRQKRRILKVALREDVVDDDFIEWTDACYCSGDIDMNLNGYRGRYQTLENARYINDFTMALVLTGVTFVVGVKAFNNSAVWGELIVYLVALRYCLNHLKKTMVAFTSINRFYPQFSRYFNFLKLYNSEHKSSFEKLPPVTISGMDHGNRGTKVKFGDVISLAGPVKVDIWSIRVYLKDLFKKNDNYIDSILRSVCFVRNNDVFLSGLSFRELLGLPAVFRLQDLKDEALIRGFNLLQLEGLPKCLDSNLSRSDWDNINDELKCSLSLLGGLLSENQLIFIDQCVMENLFPEFRANLLAGLCKKIIVLCVGNDFELLGKSSESHISIFDGSEVVAFSRRDEFLQYQEEYREQYNRTLNSSVKNQISKNYNEEDDLDDDD